MLNALETIGFFVKFYRKKLNQFAAYLIKRDSTLLAIAFWITIYGGLNYLIGLARSF